MEDGSVLEYGGRIGGLFGQRVEFRECLGILAQVKQSLRYHVLIGESEIINPQFTG